MKKATIIFVLSFISLHLFSQRQRIDSILHVLPSIKNDTIRIQLYGRLASAYSTVKPDSFFVYCDKGLALAKALKIKDKICWLSIKKASQLTDTGNFVLSKQYVQQGLAIAQELNSTPLLVDCYTEMGRLYDFQSDFVHSSDYFFKAFTLAQQINDHESIAMVGTNLSAAFFNEGNYKKSEYYSFITLKEAEIANSPNNIYRALYSIGMAEAFLTDTINAKNYYYKAIAFCKKNALVLNEAEATTDLASLEKNEAARLTLLLHARNIYDSLSPSSFNSNVNLESLGEAYLAMAQTHPAQKDLPDKAEDYINLFKKRSEAENDVASISQALQNLSKINELKGDYKHAYQYSLQYHAINDSLFSQDNKNKIATLESRNEMEKKNREIAAQTLQVREQKKNTLLLFAALVLMAAIGILFYRLSIIRKQKNKQLTQLNKELDEANKVKARFFGILSHDLRSPVANLINFLTLQKIKPDALSKEQVAARENKISASAQTLLETMEGMLLWSKSQMQQFKPEKKAVEAAALFAYIQKNFADAGHVSFAFYDEENIGIDTDENYLQTIMYNLTANAVKALQHTPHATIEWKAWKDNNQPYLSITDNGPGIATDKAKALFDSAAESHGRQGFGLHIIRDLAKAIGCSIELKSNMPKGTVVILSWTL